MQSISKIYLAGSLLSCLALPVGPATSAWAEGSTREAADQVNFGGGNNGVNRVIRTWDHGTHAASNGYTGVSGTVTVSFTMPQNEAGLYQVVDANGQPVITNHTGALDLDVQPFPVAAGTRPKGNKPSTYIGGTFPPATATAAGIMSPVDVGLQYEPTTLNDTDPGWAILFYVRQVSLTNGLGTAQSQVETNLRVWDLGAAVPSEGVPWRSSANAVAGTLTFEARASGSAEFKFSGIANGAPIYANFPRSQLAAGEQARWDVDAVTHKAAPWGDAAQPPLVVFDPADYATANVKRVTAMTRDADYTSELDGSQVVAAWTNCQVKPTGGVFRTWIADDVNQSVTGYDVPRTSALAFDKRYNGHPVPDVQKRQSATAPWLPAPITAIISRPIVQFSDDPDDDAALRAPISAANPATDARYANETVTINLGMIARPVDQPVH